MKLREVLDIQRERRGLSPAETAARLGTGTDGHGAPDQGASEAESHCGICPDADVLRYERSAGEVSRTGQTEGETWQSSL